ncbi:protein of unknown function [Legionella hackeliae]|uniref:Uncharacterized protein n=1 Tax=Legionella hackeliae TaxID=449 RepID=A0A0A8USH0_LEGHA|nr:protein of unknown function [Legionella hackeliae]
MYLTLIGPTHRGLSAGFNDGSVLDPEDKPRDVGYRLRELRVGITTGRHELSWSRVRVHLQINCDNLSYTYAPSYTPVPIIYLHLIYTSAPSYILTPHLYTYAPRLVRGVYDGSALAPWTSCEAWDIDYRRTLEYELP